eukprot:366456-Chlamydomonas_euryale.AAC.10
MQRLLRRITCTGGDEKCPPPPRTAQLAALGQPEPACGPRPQVASKKAPLSYANVAAKQSGAFVTNTNLWTRTTAQLRTLSAMPSAQCRPCQQHNAHTAAKRLQWLREAPPTPPRLERCTRERQMWLAIADRRAPAKQHLTAASHRYCTGAPAMRSQRVAFSVPAASGGDTTATSKRLLPSPLDVFSTATPGSSANPPGTNTSALADAAAARPNGLGPRTDTPPRTSIAASPGASVNASVTTRGSGDRGAKKPSATVYRACAAPPLSTPGYAYAASSPCAASAVDASGGASCGANATSGDAASTADADVAVTVYAPGAPTTRAPSQVLAPLAATVGPMGSRIAACDTCTISPPLLGPRRTCSTSDGAADAQSTTNACSPSPGELGTAAGPSSGRSCRPPRCTAGDADAGLAVSAPSPAPGFQYVQQRTAYVVPSGANVERPGNTLCRKIREGRMLGGGGNRWFGLLRCHKAGSWEKGGLGHGSGKVGGRAST